MLHHYIHICTYMLYYITLYNLTLSTLYTITLIIPLWILHSIMLHKGKGLLWLSRQGSSLPGESSRVQVLASWLSVLGVRLLQRLWWGFGPPTRATVEQSGECPNKWTHTYTTRRFFVEGALEALLKCVLVGMWAEVSISSVFDYKLFIIIVIDIIIINIYIYIYIHLSLSLYIYIYIHIHMCIYIYMYDILYIYIYTYHIILCCVILSYIILYYTVLYYITLYYRASTHVGGGNILWCNTLSSLSAWYNIIHIT